MGEVVFHKGMDDCKFSTGGNTQPGQPNKTMGGPVDGYKGSDEGHSYGTMTGNQSVPGGNVIDSPMDK